MAHLGNSRVAGRGGRRADIVRLMIWTRHRRSIVWAVPVATAVGLVLASLTYMALIPSPATWASNMNLVWIMVFGAALGAGHGLSGLLGALAALRPRKQQDPTPFNDLTVGALIGAGLAWLVAILVLAVTVWPPPGTLLLVPVGMLCAGLTAVGAAVMARRDLRRTATAGTR